MPLWNGIADGRYSLQKAKARPIISRYLARSTSSITSVIAGGLGRPVKVVNDHCVYLGMMTKPRLPPVGIRMGLSYNGYNITALPVYSLMLQKSGSWERPNTS